ncbi:hypothetical protein AAFF_G00078030 [Aldrovandia affinis]|uniref:Uncharacterized protein n=1 Tax=Aldrovandia affinis TaxID=143900 RepID=A0AAD7WD61_9TELE|nr:hypothetical protein AAFF_G00078030 [Aldrovandia affinis]
MPMSKAMREICKEEDYAFLNKQEDTGHERAEGKGLEEDEWRVKREERMRRRKEREQQEEERLRELEEMRKQKEQQWKSHVAELAAEREEALKERALRVRDFRNFERKILEKDTGPGTGCEKTECDQTHAEG